MILQLFRFLALSVVMGVLGAQAAVAARPPLANLPPIPTAPSSPAGSQSASPSDEELEAERLKLWNSPEMTAARAWMKDYFARSRAITPEIARTYLSQVEKLPPELMKEWLTRFQRDRELAAQRQDAVNRARQMSVGAALTEQQRRREAFQNVNNRSGAASTVGGFIQDQNSQARMAALQHAAERDAAAIANGLPVSLRPPLFVYGSSPMAPYAAAANPFPDGTRNLSPREIIDRDDIERSVREAR